MCHFTGTPLRLLNETFEQVKPGLSSYADDPMQVKLLSSLFELSVNYSTCIGYILDLNKGSVLAS